MTSFQQLQKEIDALKTRNKRVETDKAWETSWTRKILILFFTYSSIGIYLSAIDVKNPWLNAIIPAVAFLLSTLTLPFFKSLWKKYINKSKG